ncbi:MAG: hypothetical protein ACYC5X_03285 [Syntrophales bacterium]
MNVVIVLTVNLSPFIVNGHPAGKLQITLTLVWLYEVIWIDDYDLKWSNVMHQPTPPKNKQKSTVDARRRLDAVVGRSRYAAEKSLKSVYNLP